MAVSVGTRGLERCKAGHAVAGLLDWPALVLTPGHSIPHTSPQQAVSLVWMEMECGWAELVPALRSGVGRPSKEQPQVNESQGRLY